jgi:hypothetical protein
MSYGAAFVKASWLPPPRSVVAHMLNHCGVERHIPKQDSPYLCHNGVIFIRVPSTPRHCRTKFARLTSSTQRGWRS